MQLGSGTRSAPTCPEPCAALVEKVVDPFQFGGQEFVIMAEFEELRIRVLQELDCRFRS